MSLKDILLERCKAHFGTVRDPEINNWLLRDGVMLDFMEHPHWDIAKCMPKKERKFVGLATYKFMEMTGAMRVHYNSAMGMFIEALQGPDLSDAQKRILGPLCRKNDCTFSSVKVNPGESSHWRYSPSSSERDFHPQSLTEFLRTTRG